MTIRTFQELQATIDRILACAPQDYYNILNLSETTSSSQVSIIKNFRNLALLLHPDQSLPSNENEGKTPNTTTPTPATPSSPATTAAASKAILKAYEHLSSPTERAHYNKLYGPCIEKTLIMRRELTISLQEIKDEGVKRAAEERLAADIRQAFASHPKHQTPIETFFIDFEHGDWNVMVYCVLLNFVVGIVMSSVYLIRKISTAFMDVFFLFHLHGGFASNLWSRAMMLLWILKRFLETSFYWIFLLSTLWTFYYLLWARPHTLWHLIHFWILDPLRFVGRLFLLSFLEPVLGATRPLWGPVQLWVFDPVSCFLRPVWEWLRDYSGGVVGVLALWFLGPYLMGFYLSAWRPGWWIWAWSYASLLAIDLYERYVRPWLGF